MNNILYLQWLTAILGLCANIAAGLPLIIGIGLIAGRRGNARLFLQSAERVFKFGFWITLIGVFYFPLAFLCEVLPYGASAATIINTYFDTAGYPWFFSWLIYLICWLLFAINWLPNMKQLGAADSYPLTFIKKALFGCIILTILFFSTFMLIKWPFAGFPADMDLERVLNAIAKDSLNRFFIALGAAGGASLFVFRDSLMANDIISRWFSGWACIGFIPYLLHGWSFFLGANLNKTMLSVTWNTGMILANVCLTLGVGCWVFNFIKKKEYFIYAGFAMLIIWVSLPFIAKIIV